ncbi:MAG: efflux RND transporter permease subunit [Deltaproteobacteria bacterium]|nr:efflux RND transporter permease subunit [Deltaproteobacteria bacterium]
MKQTLGPAGVIAKAFINSKLTILIVAASLLLGYFAVVRLPREEEPQIIVPMVDVFVSMPGASAKEVEERVTNPMEKLLWEIPGVEYVYSTSSPGSSMAVVRFKVGQDEERSIVRLQSKLLANYDRIPAGVSQPLVKPRYIDDVPILALTFHSKDADHFTLRRVAAEVETRIKRAPNVSITTITGGARRTLRVLLDPARLAAYGVSPDTIPAILAAANQETGAGSFPSPEGEIQVHAGSFLKDARDVESVVAGVYAGKPVYVKDVARVIDGPEEPSQYVFMGNGPAGEKSEKEVRNGVEPAVTLSVAKRKGENAVSVANNILKRVEELKGEVIPGNIEVSITRNYGNTAREKSDELLFHMFLAVLSVTILVALTLGRRESGVVLLAIPVTLALTLFMFYLYGYTLNRITLFALIFSIGILVDDAIVVVENMVRHFRLPENRNLPGSVVALKAVDEVGNPTILATLTVIAAILPMAAVGGLMGPYMRPIPVGATAAMIFSLLVAFIVTPWAALRLLPRIGTGHHTESEDWSTRLYRKAMGPLIHRPVIRWTFLLVVILLLFGAMSMVALGLVTVKMLPFDNKSEFSVILDMPESATLETTTACALEMGEYLGRMNEVENYQVYAGCAAPFNFNGLVRHYDLRSGTNVAEIQVNLAEKQKRSQPSHEVAKRARPPMIAIAKKYGARVKVAEVPPGPPVLSTLVAEVYGPDYKRQKEIAKDLLKIFDEAVGVVDADTYMEDDQKRLVFVVDQEKAALHGIAAQRVVAAISLAEKGAQAGLVHKPMEREDLPITVVLPFSERTDVNRLTSLKLTAADGSMVPLSALVKPVVLERDEAIYHKNLMPVVYVTGDVAGAKESPVYAIIGLAEKIKAMVLPEGYAMRQHTASLPTSDQKYAMKWDGEWHITYEVFRDLGIAFAAVLILIFFLVTGWFQSFLTPIVIMAAIPFSLIGILPAHWALGAFFTATSMIGFIAGAGIVVRNSIILVDFIELRVSEGMPLDQAVIDAGAVRFRPMLLTAAAVVVGAGVILFDPIFQGLAVSLMFGEMASLIFSRMTVPILYYMQKKR